MKTIILCLITINIYAGDLQCSKKTIDMFHKQIESLKNSEGLSRIEEAQEYMRGIKICKSHQKNFPCFAKLLEKMDEGYRVGVGAEMTYCSTIFTLKESDLLNMKDIILFGKSSKILDLFD